MVSERELSLMRKDHRLDGGIVRRPRFDSGRASTLDLVVLRPSERILWRFRDPHVTATRSTRAPSAPFLVHDRTMRLYAGRLMSWFGRFRGVATKYLANYLAWHRVVDRVEERLATETSAMRWALP
jgi:hypothetical protein